MATIYVTGHRNPDTDSIASAIGYAELRRRLDPNSDYVPVRLGDINPQTNWLLERSGAPEPRFLAHVLVRACDVMHSDFPVIGQDEPIRQAGIALSRAELELVPVVDDSGALSGVVTERALARRYIRESRHTSTLRDAPTYVHAIVEVLDGELLTGDDDLLEGRVWVHAMDVATPSGISDGDVVVVGNRDDSQKLAIDLGAAMLVLSNDARPSDEVLELAREPGRGRRGFAAGLLRLGPDDHTGRAVPRADGARPAVDHHRVPARRRRRAGPREPLRCGRRGRRQPPPRRPRHAFRSRLADAPTRDPRRPRRAGPERGGRRSGRDRRDPRPPPHRLDRDAGPGYGDVRPGRLDRHAGRRALPPERDGAEPRRPRRCCSGRCCPTP